MAAKLPFNENFSLADLPGENWKDIPFLDGAYEISNFGRIKARRRWIERPGARGGFWKSERILKRMIREKKYSKDKRTVYRLVGQVSFEGKKYSFQIGRLVYHLFVQNINLDDRRFFISFKDENPFNLHYGNLKLVPVSEVVLLTFKKKHRPRECYGTKAKPVVQYDLEGNEIAIYPSISNAAAVCKIKLETLVGGLKYGNGISCGFIWRYKSSEEKREIFTTGIRKKISSIRMHNEIISQYDLNGVKQREYDDLNTAAKDVSVQPYQILAVLQGHHATAAGYYWLVGKGAEKISLEHLWQERKKWKEEIATPVTQYDLQGNFVGYYKSVCDASRQTGIPVMSIHGALDNGKSRTGKGFIWRRGKGSKQIKVPEMVKRKLHLKNLVQQPVVQYSIKGKKITEYENLRAAAKKLNGQVYNLVSVIEGKYSTFKGYCWKLKPLSDIKNKSKEEEIS